MQQLSAIDHYVTSTLARLDRTIGDLELATPRVRDRDEALAVTDRLVETLVGLAIGSVVGAVIVGVRRTFGIEAVVRRLPTPRRIDEDGGGLQRRLRGRVAIAGRDVRAMLIAIEQQLAEADRGAFARMVRLLAEDELVAERFAHQLRAGWRCASAAIEGRTIPAVDRLWQRWAQRLAGERPVVAAKLAADVMVLIA